MPGPMGRDDGVIICDDESTTSLHVFFGGNHDWYLSINDAQYPRIGPSIRCSTSGTRQPRPVAMLVACLHAVSTGNKALALARAKSLVMIIKTEMEE